MAGENWKFRSGPGKTDGGASGFYIINNKAGRRVCVGLYINLIGNSVWSVAWSGPKFKVGTLRADDAGFFKGLRNAR